MSSSFESDVTSSHLLFDAEWYLQQNPDVAQAGVDPFEHYMTHGWREGRDPHPEFNTTIYLEKNPDIAAAGENPLVHYAISSFRAPRLEETARSSSATVVLRSQNTQEENYIVASTPVSPETYGLQRAPILKRKPKYSFVIPVYDRTTVVYESISSCLNQTWEDLEVVVVLDGSPPETVEVVKSFSDPRLKVFSYPVASGTACRGRNRGILEAQGEYICFLDSDDISSPLRLHHLEELQRNSQFRPDVMYGAVVFLPEVERINGIGWGDVGLPNPSGFSLEDLLEANQVYTLTASVRRNTLLKFGGFRTELKYREDYELWLRLKYHNCSFSFTNEVLSLYRIHNENNELNFKSEDRSYYLQSVSLYQKQFNHWSV